MWNHSLVMRNLVQVSWSCLKMHNIELSQSACMYLSEADVSAWWWLISAKFLLPDLCHSLMDISLRWTLALGWCWRISLLCL